MKIDGLTHGVLRALGWLGTTALAVAIGMPLPSPFSALVPFIVGVVAAFVEYRIYRRWSALMTQERRPPIFCVDCGVDPAGKVMVGAGDGIGRRFRCGTCHDACAGEGGFRS